MRKINDAILLIKTRMHFGNKWSKSMALFWQKCFKGIIVSALILNLQKTQDKIILKKSLTAKVLFASSTFHHYNSL